MNLTRWTAVLTVACATTACATERAPLHVYQSPLLAANTENPRVADRTFDPVQPDDIGGETVVAQSEDSGQRARREARKMRQSRKLADTQIPALSIGSVGGYEDDVSGSGNGYAPMVAAAYVYKTFEVNGVILPPVARNSVPRLWDACRTHGTVNAAPRVGDAVFFHNVFDANGDGRNNDWYTHVGIVESVRGGAVTVLSWRDGTVSKFSVNPSKADDLDANSQIREPAASDAPFTQYHAGHLFAGWCSVMDGKQDVVVMDSWSP